MSLGVDVGPDVGELPETLIRQAFRQMVAFVATESGSARVPKGTAFFVGVPINEHADQCYAVTARHVVEGARKAGSMYLRLNVVGGGFEDVGVDPNSWLVSQKTDVAVVRVDLPRDRYVFAAYPFKWLLTGREAEERDVGHGDDLFFVGLFTQHPGRISAEPIVRFGNIPLMPGEPIRNERSGGTVVELRAYLAEARSWGGNSGSPCFIYFPAHRYGGVWMQPIDTSTTGGVMTDELVAEATMPRLLGVVVGHFNIRKDVAFAYDETSEDLAVNSGMAIVVPADDLIEVLMDESLMEERRMTADEHRGDEPVANSDSVANTDFERFEDLTRKLVSVPKEEIDEKRKERDS